MIRSLFFVVAGIILGLMIHLIVMLSLPSLAEQSNWDRVADLDAQGKMNVLESPSSFSANPFRLDPNLNVAICRLDLAQGPGIVNGVLPDSFWTVSVFDRDNRSVYGTTNKSELSSTLQMGIFNPSQTRLLAQRELEITEGLLIVESALDEIYVVVRALSPYPALEARTRAQLETISCGNVEIAPPEEESQEPEITRDPSFPYPAERPIGR